jgi:hypothetical protein
MVFMKEHIPENELPLNKLAKALLKREGFSPDPDFLYVAQVVNFALEKGWIKIKNPDLEDWVESLSVQPPEDVMKFLNLEELQPPYEIPSFAALVLGELDAFLTENWKGYL